MTKSLNSRGTWEAKVEQESHPSKSLIANFLPAADIIGASASCLYSNVDSNAVGLDLRMLQV